MGYEVSMDVQVLIPLKKARTLKKIFKELERKSSTLGSGFSGKKQYAFVSSGFAECDTIEEMFESWRYSVVRNDTHFVVESFDGQKLGDDQILWEHLEKVVEESSKIYLSGEDGTNFRWTFKDGKFKETYADIVYDDE